MAMATTAPRLWEPLGVYSPREQHRQDEDRRNLTPDAHVVTNTLISIKAREPNDENGERKRYADVDQHGPSGRGRAGIESQTSGVGCGD